MKNMMKKQHLAAIQNQQEKFHKMIRATLATKPFCFCC
jgi:hypothetical protein